MVRRELQSLLLLPDHCPPGAMGIASLVGLISGPLALVLGSANLDALFTYLCYMRVGVDLR